MSTGMIVLGLVVFVCGLLLVSYIIAWSIQAIVRMNEIEREKVRREFRKREEQ